MHSFSGLGWILPLLEPPWPYLHRATSTCRLQPWEEEVMSWFFCSPILWWLGAGFTHVALAEAALWLLQNICCWATGGEARVASHMPTHSQRPDRTGGVGQGRVWMVTGQGRGQIRPGGRFDCDGTHQILIFFPGLISLPRSARICTCYRAAIGPTWPIGLTEAYPSLEQGSKWFQCTRLYKEWESYWKVSSWPHCGWSIFQIQLQWVHMFPVMGFVSSLGE